MEIKETFDGCAKHDEAIPGLAKICNFQFSPNFSANFFVYTFQSGMHQVHK